jgi:hypothetical protein
VRRFSGLSKEELNKLNQVERSCASTTFSPPYFETIFDCPVWIGFGCYGVYVFNHQVFLQMAKSVPNSSSSTRKWLCVTFEQWSTSMDGTIISQGADSSVTDEGTEKITHRVAAAL